MSRIVLNIFLVFSYVSSACSFKELAVDSIIRGVNQAGHQIWSGEVQFTATDIHHDARKSEQEIALWMREERERKLKGFRPNSYNTDIDQKKFQEYLEEHLNFWAEWHRQRTENETTVMAFRILDRDDIFYPKFHQFKMAIKELPGLPLDSKEAQWLQAGSFYLRTYDGIMLAREDFGNIVVPTPTFRPVRLSTSGDLGFRRFALFGRATVPATAKRVGKEIVDGAECQVLVSNGDGWQNKIWVDPSRDFCVRRSETRASQDGPIGNLMEYQDFRRFGDIWYPTIIRIASFENLALSRMTTIEVKDAEFNVDFPKGFFKVDPGLYGASHHMNAPKFDRPPTLPESETDSLLLLCGPRSLLHICEILNVKTNLRELKELTRFDPSRGTTMLGLKKAATYKGLTPQGVKANLKGLRKKKVPMPAIAYINGDHFLVFEAIQSNGVKISDPAEKYNPHLSWKQLSEIWEGELLIFDTEGQPPKSESIPLAFAPEEEYDFGEALGGSEVRHNFTIQNIGQQPLTILSMTETCACTAAMVSQRDVPAGANAIIEAVLKVPSENTLVEESISVFTNDPTQNTLILTFKGRAFVPLKTFPERLAFGNQKLVQRPLTKRISLHLRTEVEILGVRTDSEHISAILTHGQIPHVEVQLLPTIPIGQFSHHLLVDYRYGGKESTHDIFVFGEVLGAFRVTPKQFFFGMVKSAEMVSKIATISSIDDQPFKILSVEPSVESVVASATKSSDGASYRITTTINSKSLPRELSGEIVVKTNSTVQPTLRIPFFGIIGE